MNVFTRMAAALDAWKHRPAATFHVDVKLSTFGRRTLTMIEARKLADRLFKGRNVSSVSKHANDDGVTLLFIDGTRGDVEACDAMEILKYLD